MTSDRSSGDHIPGGASGKAPVTIKKYANRRLYNTGTSVYVTLEDLAAMVKNGDDFVVYDAKTGDDITRSVLAQIIFEQEGKGQSLLPITFLRQLIRFYGDSMQMLVPSYLEFSLAKLAQERGGLGPLFAGSEALTSATRPVFAQMEEQARQNMAMFRQALAMFPPFPGAPRPADAARPAAPSTPTPGSQALGSQASASHAQTGQEPAAPAQNRDALDEMRHQIEELQRRLEVLAPKP